MQFDPKLTLDGLMTLVGGALALIGVWWSNHRSTANLQKQLEAENTGRIEERERQKRAVATAILFEIDNIYRYLLRDVRQFLAPVNPDTVDLAEFGSMSTLSDPYAVFTANAGAIGVMDAALVEDIVGFYGALKAYLGALEAFCRDRERWRAPSDSLTEDAARQRLGGAKNSIQPLVLAAYRASSGLCQITAVHFEASTIAVAAEDLEALTQEVARLENTDPNAEKN